VMGSRGRREQPDDDCEYAHDDASLPATRSDSILELSS
jgi:hypothetical protein